MQQNILIRNFSSVKKLYASVLSSITKYESSYESVLTNRTSCDVPFETNIYHPYEHWYIIEGNIAQLDQTFNQIN